MTILFRAASREIARDLLLARGYELQPDGTFALATGVGGVVRIVADGAAVRAEIALDRPGPYFSNLIEGAACRFEERRFDRERRLRLAIFGRAPT